MTNIHSRLNYDLVFCYKMLHGCDVEFACRNTLDNNVRLAKHFCYTDIIKYVFNNRAWTIFSNNFVMSPSLFF